MIDLDVQGKLRSREMRAVTALTKCRNRGAHTTRLYVC